MGGCESACVLMGGCNALSVYQLELLVEKHHSAAPCFECHPQSNNKHSAGRMNDKGLI